MARCRRSWISRCGVRGEADLGLVREVFGLTGTETGSRIRNSVPPWITIEDSAGQEEGGIHGELL